VPPLANCHFCYLSNKLLHSMSETNDAVTLQNRVAGSEDLPEYSPILNFADQGKTVALERIRKADGEPLNFRQPC